MWDDAMENAFSAYLDSEECEKLQEAFFAAVRAAFLAGWEAALKTDVPFSGNSSDLSK